MSTRETRSPFRPRWKSSCSCGTTNLVAPAGALRFESCRACRSSGGPSRRRSGPRTGRFGARSAAAIWQDPNGDFRECARKGARIHMAQSLEKNIRVTAEQWNRIEGGRPRAAGLVQSARRRARYRGPRPPRMAADRGRNPLVAVLPLHRTSHCPRHASLQDARTNLRKSDAIPPKSRRSSRKTESTIAERRRSTPVRRG